MTSIAWQMRQILGTSPRMTLREPAMGCHNLTAGARPPYDQYRNTDMVELYGTRRSRRDLSAHTGSLTQFAGVRLMTLGDGVERGVRMLEFRSGTGLRFTVMVDRCLDIGDCDYRGMSIGRQ